MSKINLLSEDLINKIAAGEVIERPASVVKELVENSLDAGADIITVEIKDSGKKLIKISDNGSGMSEEDAKKCILRHATSKISKADDLFSIQTLGFRGEALASIAAVSRLSIITKQKDLVEGFNLVVEGGKEISSGIIGTNTGTTIEVHDLFFNVPARKKFLKTDAVELRHIVDTVLKYALINPTVSFKLVHEKHELVSSPAVKDLQGKIASIYGINLAKELLEVSSDQEAVKVTGFICKPYQARNDKNQQQIFVNNRWIRNETINKAVYEAYHSLLFVGKHPVFILNIEINPEEIDVNVHPAKTEIKIEQKEQVFSAVMEAVRKTLENHDLIPELDIDHEEQLTFGIDKKEVEVKKEKAKYLFEPSKQTILKDKEESPIISVDNFEEGSYTTPEEEVFVSEQKEKRVLEKSLRLPAMKILGQIHKTFFIAETEGGALFIDQHVVQERVLYEKFMKQLMNKEVAVQELLQGEVIEFSAAEKVYVNESLVKMKELGFTLEEFGGNSFVLKTVPSLFGRLQAKDLLFSVLDKLKEGKNKLEEIQEEIITRMACRASVKAGDTMTIREIEKLLSELAECQLPYTCPHGRAVLIKVPVSELEKKFKRK
ncbi:DNA mismatch repair endonuclease MutL [Candidatus Woesearchaeota archaeon]|jgi:DNA mismatch repair protein MutL|nr:DNA mismatch repair endonuclease MutL [Candidatus Woesearchaeota archaeon]MBT4111253.1 DNA mismatch repair endonuclease MutL [Candidatus Woesearchaeota archaeon]MBT4336833.1 DNA mismatch repair endonuclease MutL [Candidatus Woesearchaeota archaeon]MBT4469501.1 DNA mismatch repair endonuclease MutL [Candidatus Woesearchaeota archaeon]MBT6744104.1 DNA mismatch repair endonuclease MutL [Candidatus Woesearchaeota archaeon]